MQLAFWRGRKETVACWFPCLSGPDNGNPPRQGAGRLRRHFSQMSGEIYSKTSLQNYAFRPKADDPRHLDLPHQCPVESFTRPIPSPVTHPLWIENGAVWRCANAYCRNWTGGTGWGLTKRWQTECFRLQKGAWRSAIFAEVDCGRNNFPNQFNYTYG